MAFLIRSASACTGPWGEGRDATSSAAIRGCAATVCAMARARLISSSSSWWLSGARKSPVASAVTPTVIDSSLSSTCAETRRGHPIRMVGSSGMFRRVVLRRLSEGPDDRSGGRAVHAR